MLLKGAPGEVYHAGGPDEMENLDVVHRILELTGQDESLIKYVTDRKGHDRFAEPRREPQLDARLPGGDEGRGERGDADGDLSPSWDRRERPRALHGLADEAQII